MCVVGGSVSTVEGRGRLDGFGFVDIGVVDVKVLLLFVAMYSFYTVEYRISTGVFLFDVLPSPGSTE